MAKWDHDDLKNKSWEDNIRKPTLPKVPENKWHSMGLIYLATPYSKYVEGIEVAFEEAAKLTGRMLVAGAAVYSPITHTHPIALYADLNPLDHSIWLPFDEHMMCVCDTLVVADMAGWKESKGIRHEIAFFKSKAKPIVLLDTKTLEPLL